MIKLELTEPQVRALLSCGTGAIRMVEQDPGPQRRGFKIAIRPAVAELSRKLAEDHYCREKRARGRR